MNKRDVSFEVTQHFSHKERRYIVSTRLLDSVRHTLGAGRNYEVHTTYLDTPERTWSGLTMGENHPKIRFRIYDGKDSFLEKKLHVGSETTKERIAVKCMPEGLVVVGEITYSRTEYTIEGVRVTLDTSDAFSFCIIEIKGRVPEPLRFLRPFEDKRFSKWRFITAQWKSERK